MENKPEIDKELVKKAKADLKEEVVKETELTEKQKATLAAIFEEAKQPIKMSDKDFKLGEGELDIRGLSPENREQMRFRMMCHEITYLRQINMNLVDILRLVIVILKQLGVEDVIKATDMILEDLKNAVATDSGLKDKNKDLPN